MSDIGFAGLGRIGLPILNRIRSKFAVKAVYNRNRSKAEGLEGIRVVEEPFHLGTNCNIIFLALSDDAACESVIFGQNGIARTLRPRSLVVNLSTVSHQFAVSAIRRLQENMCSYLEAPVQGGTTMAAEGELTSFVSGPEEAYKTVSAVIDTYSSRVIQFKQPGTATKMNLISNMVAAVNLAAVGEAMVMAGKAGITPESAIEALENSSSASQVLSAKKETILSDAYETEFSLNDMAKSLGYSDELSRALNSPITMSSAASQFYTAAMSIGLGNLDFSSVMRAFRFMIGRS